MHADRPYERCSSRLAKAAPMSWMSGKPRTTCSRRELDLDLLSDMMRVVVLEAGLHPDAAMTCEQSVLLLCIRLVFGEVSLCRGGTE